MSRRKKEVEREAKEWRKNLPFNERCSLSLIACLHCCYSSKSMN